MNHQTSLSFNRANNSNSLKHIKLSSPIYSKHQVNKFVNYFLHSVILIFQGIILLNNNISLTMGKINLLSGFIILVCGFILSFNKINQINEKNNCLIVYKITESIISILIKIVLFENGFIQDFNSCLKPWIFIYVVIITFQDVNLKEYNKISQLILILTQICYYYFRYQIFQKIFFDQLVIFLIIILKISLQHIIEPRFAFSEQHTTIQEHSIILENQTILKNIDDGDPIQETLQKVDKQKQNQTEINLISRSLQSQDIFLNNIVNQLNQGIILIDQTIQVIFANKSSLNLFNCIKYQDILQKLINNEDQHQILNFNKISKSNSSPVQTSKLNIEDEVTIQYNQIKNIRKEDISKNINLKLKGNNQLNCLWTYIELLLQHKQESFQQQQLKVSNSELSNSLIYSCQSNSRDKELSNQFNLDYQVSKEEISIKNYVINDFNLSVKISLISYDYPINKKAEYGKKFAVLLICEENANQNYLSYLKDNNDFKIKLLSSLSNKLLTPIDKSIKIINFNIDQKLEDKNQLKQHFTYLNNYNQICWSFLQDALLFVNLELGKQKILLCQFNIYEVLKDCINIFEQQMKEKNIIIKLQADNNIPPMINSNQNALRQILINLLCNAVKYQSKGIITLSAYYESFSELIKIQIIDKGQGISQQQQSKIFHQWNDVLLTQNHIKSNRDIGIGLIIASKLAYALGGNNAKLKLESKQYKGSIFSFYVKNFSNENKSIIIPKNIYQNCNKRSNDPLYNSEILSLKLKTQQSSNLISKTSPQEIQLIIDDQGNANQSEQQKIRQENLQLKQNQFEEDQHLSIENSQLFSNQQQSQENSFSNNQSQDNSNIVHSDRQLEEDQMRRQSLHPMETKDFNKYFESNLIIRSELDNDLLMMQGRLAQQNNDKVVYKQTSLSTQSLNFYQLTKKCNCIQILIVDNEIHHQLALQNMFKTFNYKTEFASNEQQAFTLIKHKLLQNKCCNYYKLIVLDLSSSSMNGIEVSNQVLQLFKQEHVNDKPIICLSFKGKLDQVTKNNAKKMGLIHFIQKPLKPDELKKFLLKIKLI